MTRRTLVPSIPDVRDDNLREVLTAIKSTLEVREGMIGDPLDRAATLRDLVALNIAGTDQTNLAIDNTGAAIPVSPVWLPLPDGYDPTTDFTIPPAPTGLVATGGFTNVVLDWNGAPYRNHSYTEIWRNTTDNLGTAIRIGITPADVYSDAAEPSTTYYYWIRFVSKANIYGPYNATSGTPATTAIDVTEAISNLTDEITGSQLFVDLGTRVGSSEVSINSLNGQYTVKIDNNGYVSGFGLASTSNTTTPSSSFIVRADSFSIANPAGPNIVAPAMPFIVRTTETTVDGVTVPVGVYITDAFIQNGSIVSAKIGTAAITTAKISDAAITTAKIGSAAITAATISDGAITTAKIGDAAITTAKIASAAITSALINDAAITTAKIADAAITSAKIGSLAVDTANINSGAITTAKIGNAAITTATINDGAITNAKLGAASVGTLKIAGEAVFVTRSNSNFIESVTVTQTALDICSVNVTISGLGADETAPLIVQGFTNYSPAGTNGASIVSFLRVGSSGAITGEYGVTVGAFATFSGVQGFVALGNGTYTFRIMIKTGTPGDANKTVGIVSSILVQTGKR